jgi:hypothetical protein
MSEMQTGSVPRRLSDEEYISKLERENAALREELRITEERAIAAENEVFRLTSAMPPREIGVYTTSETPTEYRGQSVGAGGSVYTVGGKDTETKG